MFTSWILLFLSTISHICPSGLCLSVCAKGVIVIVLQCVCFKSLPVQVNFWHNLCVPYGAYHDTHSFIIFISGIAALTFGIQQLVVGNINGRSLSGSHVYNSDEAIYHSLMKMIEESSSDENYPEDYWEAAEDVYGNEDKISEKFSSNFFSPAQRKSGKVVCYGRLGLCLTRSVFMSLKYLDNEGIVLGGLLGAFIEIVTTGSMKDAWEGLAKIDHVRHTRGCLRDLDSCSA